jgi:hypothetical protein
MWRDRKKLELLASVSFIRHPSCFSVNFLELSPLVSHNDDALPWRMQMTRLIFTVSHLVASPHPDPGPTQLCCLLLQLGICGLVCLSLLDGILFLLSSCPPVAVSPLRFSLSVTHPCPLYLLTFSPSFPKFTVKPLLGSSAVTQKREISSLSWCKHKLWCTHDDSRNYI